MCVRELDEPGGIILSAPDEQTLIRKAHLCKQCTHEVESFIGLQRIEKARTAAKWGRCTSCGDKVTADLPGNYHLRLVSSDEGGDPMEIKCGPVKIGA
jgi:hypothetical protein